MENMEEKLNALLGDPDAMKAIMGLAQQLSQEHAPPRSESRTDASRDAAKPDIDPSLLARFLPLLQKITAGGSSSTQLLYALRPYLRPQKQEKIDRAVKIARVIHIAHQFLAEGGWDLV